jgi:hypothetical protein
MIPVKVDVPQMVTWSAETSNDEAVVGCSDYSQVGLHLKQSTFWLFILIDVAVPIASSVQW